MPILKSLTIFVSILSISSLAASFVPPAGEYRTLERSTSSERTCGRVRLSLDPTQYPGLSLEVSEVPGRNKVTYDFPKLGDLPPKSGYDRRRIRTYSTRGVWDPYTFRHRDDVPGFCFENLDEIDSRDPSDYGSLDYETACFYFAQELFLTISPSARNDGICVYMKVAD